MANNTLLTPSLISMETLVILENNLVAAAKVNRRFEEQFVKIGSTLTIRKPNRFTVTNGPGLSIQNITEPSTSITISFQQHVDFLFTDQDLTLVIEEFSERYLKPAAAALANQIDSAVLGLWTQIFNEVGINGTTPNSYSFIKDVAKRMDLLAMPQDGRCLVLGADAYWELDNALINLFVTKVSEPALKGYLANLANFEIYLDQNIQAQTVGAYGGTPVVNGATQTGSSIVTNGWTVSVTNLLNTGDMVTFAGVFSVNPQSRASTNFLANFVITAPVNSDSGGNATLPISPAIVTTGAYQNVTGSPANLAAIVVKGSASTSYGQNLAFVKDTFGLVTVPLELPGGVDFAARNEYRGTSMAIVRAFDITNYQMPCRTDILYGVACFYPEIGVRLTN